MAAPPASSRSLGERLTAKVGPLPVWGWAVGILAFGFLAYRLYGGSTSAGAGSSASVDTGSSSSQPTTDLSSAGNVGPSSTGSEDVSSLNDSVLSQLSGLGTSVDNLTSLVQSTPAFWTGDGSGGSGSTVPNGTPTAPPAAPPATTQKPAPTTTTKTATVRYYTYAPGKAPKNRKGDEAPARGPAGTSLHFMSGRGYYYA